MIYILGVDPGDTTGLAMWSEGVPTEVAHVQVNWKHVREWVERMQHHCSDATWIFAVERFVIARNTVRKKNAAKTAPDVIAQVRSIADVGDHEFRLRGASEAKTFATNDRLKRIGWYKPGMGHANDAARQVLLCVAQCFPKTFIEIMETSS